MAGLALRVTLLVLSANLLPFAKHTVSSQVNYQEVSIEEKHSVHFTYVARRKCTFTLLYNKVAFYQDGSTGTISYEEYPLHKQERSTVKVHKSFDFLVVTLTIKNTKPTDAGIYLCLFHCPTAISQNYELMVNYTPKPTRCRWMDDYWASMLNLLGLRVLSCSIENGYPSDTVKCFSYMNDKATSHDPLSLRDDNHTAIFWFNKNVNITCCSMSLTFQKDWHTCHDFYSDERLKKYRLAGHENIPPVTPLTLLKKHNDQGKASCVLGQNTDNNTHEKWALLECTASVGNYSSFIACYQDGEKLPPLSPCMPPDNNQNLRQKFWIQKEMPIFCCASTYNNPRNMCACDDFVGHFSKDINVSVIYPRPLGTIYSTTSLAKGLHMMQRSGEHTQVSSINTHGKTSLNLHDDPGKPSCVLRSDYDNVTYMYEHWARIECTASKGNHQGFIACYQDGQRMLPWNLPIENDTSFIQTIWIQRNMPIFCCSITQTKQKSMCECNDFITDFSQSGNDTLELDPCPETTSPSTTSEIHTTPKPTNCHKLRRDFLNECL